MLELYLKWLIYTEDIYIQGMKCSELLVLYKLSTRENADFLFDMSDNYERFYRSFEKK